MKLKKFLLGSALFLVVSLCSLTLAYADDTVHGTIKSGITYRRPMVNSITGAETYSLEDYVYDFPLTHDETIWDYSSTPPDMSLGFTIGFDTPVSNGILYLRFIEIYNNSLPSFDTVRVYYSDTTSEVITSKVNRFSYGYGNIGMTLNFSNLSKPVVHIDFLFNETSGHTKVHCSFANFIPNDYFGQNIRLVTGPAFATITKYINISYDSALFISDFLTREYGGDFFPRSYSAPPVFPEQYKQVVNFFVGSSFGYGTSIVATFLTSSSVAESNYVVFYDPTYDALVKFIVDDSTNYGNETVLSLEELIELMGGNGGVDHENEQAQQAITEVDDALGQQEELEGEWRGSMTANFNALAVSSFDFDTDTASGLTLVGSVFSSLWNSMGKWSVLYSFPLLLGVVLLLIGRISRHDKKERREQSKSNKK